MQGRLDSARRREGIVEGDMVALKVNLAFTLMSFALHMMSFAVKLMDFVSKMMDFAFKMMTWWH